MLEAQWELFVEKYRFLESAVSEVDFKSFIKSEQFFRDFDFNTFKIELQNFAQEAHIANSREFCSLNKQKSSLEMSLFSVQKSGRIGVLVEKYKILNSTYPVVEDFDLLKNTRPALEARQLNITKAIEALTEIYGSFIEQQEYQVYIEHIAQHKTLIAQFEARYEKITKYAQSLVKAIPSSDLKPEKVVSTFLPIDKLLIYQVLNGEITGDKESKNEIVVEIEEFVEIAKKFSTGIQNLFSSEHSKKQSIDLFSDELKDIFQEEFSNIVDFCFYDFCEKEGQKNRKNNSSRRKIMNKYIYYFTMRYGDRMAMKSDQGPKLNKQTRWLDKIVGKNGSEIEILQRKRDFLFEKEIELQAELKGLSEENEEVYLLKYKTSSEHKERITELQKMIIERIKFLKFESLKQSEDSTNSAKVFYYFMRPHEDVKMENSQEDLQNNEDPFFYSKEFEDSKKNIYSNLKVEKRNDDKSKSRISDGPFDWPNQHHVLRNPKNITQTIKINFSISLHYVNFKAS